MLSRHQHRRRSLVALQRPPNQKFLMLHQPTQSLQMRRRVCQLALSEFPVRATILLLRAKAWEFHVRLLVRATILLHHRREWVALVRVVQLRVVRVRQVPVARVAQVVRVVRVRLVPVAHRAQVSAARVRQVPEQLQVELQVLLARAVALAAVAVAALAVAPRVLSVRVARATRPASQSVRSAKSMNRDRHRAWVEQ
jgi:hypothetical protein